jgi:hypothetical protein
MKHPTALPLLALLTLFVPSACGSLIRLADRPNQPIAAVASPTSAATTDHHCADLLAQSMVQVGPVHGVWNCLEPAVQSRYTGSGDQAMSEAAAYFLAPATLIGCHQSVCVYSLPLEATTAAKLGISETTMTIWLDDDGLVAYAAVPAALR